MNHQTIIERYLSGRPHEASGRTLIVPTEARDLADTIRTFATAGLPLLTVFATDDRRAHGTFRIQYVFGVPRESTTIVIRLDLVGAETFPSVAGEFPQFALYEREIQSLFGLKPLGHPDPRSFLLHEENWPAGHYPLHKDFAWDTRLSDQHSGEYRFNRVDGEGVYEIPVGPVHAGIIEPGHFRFSVLGEEIIALEARLGWVHKGVEKLFEELSLQKKVALAERISGDSAFSHSLCFCEALEMLAGVKAPPRAAHLRLIFAELERLTMHIFDIGNIAGNGTGFSFMSSQGFRMVEELRRLSEKLSDSRFLRGINVPGGISRDLSDGALKDIQEFLKAFRREFEEVMNVADRSASLTGRLKETGVLSLEVARELGAVGIAARSIGISKDVRLDYPYAAYGAVAPKIVLEEAGDVYARFRVRVREVYESIRLIESAIPMLPQGAVQRDLPPLPKEGIAISAVEGWRGEIVYALVAEGGVLSRVKPRDPSFINWQLFAHLISPDMVPDFPLINKSLNLSYTGNDL